MRQIIGHRITLVIATIVMILCAYWFYTTKDIEALVCTISSFGVLITGVFFTVNPAENTLTEKQAQSASGEASTTTKNKYNINNKGAKIGQQNIGSTVTNHNSPKK